MPILQRILLSCSCSVCFFIVAVCAFTTAATAQYRNDIWEAPNKAKASLSKKTGKSASTIKKWKDHLQQWGLDSNYNHAIYIGGRLYTNGWGGEVLYQKSLGDEYSRQKGKHLGQSQFYRLGFSEVKHEKEIKQQRENTSYPELGNSSPFIYGKLNNVYLLQLSFGREQLLFPGVLQGNISLSFRYSGGLSLAMLKPYYVRLLHVDYSTSPEKVWLQEERYSEGNKDLFLSRDRVFGASKWSKGLGSIDYVPGAFIEGAFTIEPAKGKNFVQLISIGGQLSVYSKPLLIMAEQKAYPFMGAFYVGLALGKRW